MSWGWVRFFFFYPYITLLFPMGKEDSALNRVYHLLYVLYLLIFTLTLRVLREGS